MNLLILVFETRHLVTQVLHFVRYIRNGIFKMVYLDTKYFHVYETSSLNKVTCVIILFVLFKTFCCLLLIFSARQQTDCETLEGSQYEISCEEIQGEGSEEVIQYQTVRHNLGASSSFGGLVCAGDAESQKTSRRSTCLPVSDASEGPVFTASGEDTDAMVDKEMEQALECSLPKSPTADIASQIQEQIALEKEKTPLKNPRGVPGNPFPLGVSPIAERLAAAVPKRKRKDDKGNKETRKAKPKAYRSPTPYSEISDQDQFSEVS